MQPIVLALLLASLPAASAENVPVLKDGAQCAKSKSPAKDGETHRCFFEPGEFGNRDFSTRNGRAQYIFTVLGPNCDVMEIPADEAVADSPDSAAPLRRVSVLCEG